ncbi:Hypothetical protein A7982_00044 [Minicystis rosea]|nr:Hypothetical protein A7982_00044 [Minicystis rosea]
MDRLMTATSCVHLSRTARGRQALGEAGVAAPDNNNALFGENLARELIMNRNDEASKTRGWSPP